MDIMQLVNRLSNIFQPQSTFDVGGMDFPQPGLNLPPLATPPIMPNPRMGISIAGTQPDIDPEQAFADDWIQKNYQPQNQMSELLSQMVQNMPQYQAPGFWRKLGAAFGGMATDNPGVAANQLANLPYLNEVQRWQTQFEPVLKAAGLEQQGNQNSRIMAEQTLQRILQERRDAELARKNRATEDINQQKVDIARRRAAVYEFKNTHPNWQLKTREDGNIVAINPQDPTMVIDTQVRSNELSDLQKIELGLDAKLKEISAQGGETRRNIAAQGEQTRLNILTPRPSTSTGADSAIGQTRALYLRAQKAKIEHPEWSPFIGLGSNNTVIVTPPGKNGPTPEVHSAIQQYLLQDTKSKEIGGTTINTPSNGKILVINKEGKKGYIPASQLEEALKQGYKRVQ